MRCVFAGTPDVAAVALRALLDSRHEPVAVLTRPDARAGRGKELAASPVAVLAREAGLELLQPTSTRDAALAERLAALAPDCAPIVAYGGLIPAGLLDVPRLGWVNLHFSLLPAWRGAAPVQHAVWHGDDVTGATTFRLDEGMDTGPVFGTVTEAVRPDDTSGDLLARLAVTGAGLLIATLDALEEGAVQAVAQSGEPSLAPKLGVDDARIRWDHPAVGVDRLVRACTPAPGAWTMVGDDRLRVQPVRIVADGPQLAPGQIEASRDEVLVGTASAPVRLGLVQPAGKRPMPAADWVRGARLAPGTVLR
ncbi:MAG: methionyl-tRNA formyltransferase [Actinomycetota bacterium]|nr:methionyl-tRNA formyltransferase [Actinomycetota bacterium]